MQQELASTNNSFTGRMTRFLSLLVLSVLLSNIVLPTVVLAVDAADSPASDGSASVTANEVASTLGDVPGILGSSDQVATQADADSAATTTVAGTAIDIPKDPEQGVTFGAVNGPKLDVELPNADAANDGEQVAPGVVAYPSGDGSANAVQANEDGSVRMMIIIDTPSAPTEYDYKVNVPNGGSVQIIEDGGAAVLDSAGQLISMVGAPWAKDANGTPVNTWFTTDGQTLTQHVQHNVPGVVYPVTADPIWFAVSAAVFWWAVQRCGAGGMIGAVFEYVGGSRSARAIAAAGAAGCIASFVGGWGILKNLVRIVRW